MTRRVAAVALLVAVACAPAAPLTFELEYPVMPGRDPGGPIATLMMGVGGSVIGCGTLMFFFDARNITPISVIGFATATGGATRETRKGCSSVYLEEKWPISRRLAPAMRARVAACTAVL